MKSDMPAHLYAFPLLDPGRRGQFQANEVGRNLYVWSRNSNGGPSHERCVISAHGGAARISNDDAMRKLPRGVQIVFYGPHGYNLQNPSLYKVVTGIQQPYETIGTGNLLVGQDYELSKCQDAHNSASCVDNAARGTGEGYKFIGEDMHDMRSYHQRTITGGVMGKTAAHNRAEAAAEHDNYQRRIDMDVVTVGTRKVMWGKLPCSG